MLNLILYLYLNWDLLNDGVGNPKNTRSLLLAHKTPPAMFLGVRANAEAAVRAHDGEARASRVRYEALSAAERAQLLAFLDTL